MTVTAADVDLLGSNILVAVMVTAAIDGTVAGAAYSPVGEIDPQAVPVQPGPVALQVTAVLAVPVTKAVNC